MFGGKEEQKKILENVGRCLDEEDILKGKTKKI